MRTYVEADDIKLVYSGKNFFEVLEEVISNSREYLHLQTYIFETDETGFKVMGWLKAAAARGVKVYMLVDAYASFPFPASIAADLRQCGIHFRLFSPLFSSENIFIGRRLHHKIVVADRNVGLTGGINIADKYNINVEENAWLDYAVLIQGNVCEYLHVLCERIYKKKQGPGPLALWERRLRITGNNQNNRFVRFRRNDWIRGRNEIHHSYLEAINRSETCITMVASYFLPGDNVRRLLRKAAQRGVEIRIILAGRSDVRSVRLAEQYLYDFYLRHGIHVYEWTDSVMHGKAMIVDDTWATIGSYNLNFLSHYVSIELNADIIDTKFVQTFSSHLNSIINTSGTLVEIKGETAKRFFLVKFVMWMAYNFFRLLNDIATRGRKYRKKLRQK